MSVKIHHNRTHLNITLLGGGVWIAELLQQLASSRVLPSMTFRLAAQNQKRLKIIAHHCELTVKRIREDCSVIASESLEDALSIADTVVCMIRVGGMQARKTDENFPLQFGVPGDEGLGLGGIANALRSVPVIQRVCDLIAVKCPNAKVFNLMAPLGVTTRVFLDNGLDAIGVCELPAVTERKLLTASCRSALQFEYGGFNHLGWFWPEFRGDQIQFPMMEFFELADRETIQRYQAVPLWYYPKLFGLHEGGSKARNNRAEQLSTLAESVLENFRSSPGSTDNCIRERYMPWFAQALVPILEAEFGGAFYQGFLNVRNGALIPKVASNLVVEVRARIKNGETFAIACQKIPSKVQWFLEGIARAENETYRGATTLDINEKRRSVKSALVAYRDVGLPISTEQLDEIVSEVIHCSVM